jgi:hypothetical protein
LDNQNNTLKEKVEELKATVVKTDSQNTVLKEKADCYITAGTFTRRGFSLDWSVTKH